MTRYIGKNSGNTRKNTNLFAGAAALAAEPLTVIRARILGNPRITTGISARYMTLDWARKRPFPGNRLPAF